MAIDKDQLGRDETIVMSMRTHTKRLIVPALILVVLGAALGVAIAFFPPESRPWSTYASVAVFVLLVVIFSVVPFLRWHTSTYTVTDRRIITRKGIITKVGHDLPLRRINNVNYQRGLLDRMLGCGTLILETAAGQP
ncbi:PH domain-containing protein [Tessaracoccus coleopterorum]|uniref:PH domain-containing protein n=1 Tax=Tessaracoccus coleopterorum TaxID=2714950 RepID=UPI001E5611C0|nr:PH domain-containing protein [Tessaracoccus coleopterorum]